MSDLSDPDASIPPVAQVFIYASSGASWLLAVIAPDLSNIDVILSRLAHLGAALAGFAAALSYFVPRAIRAYAWVRGRAVPKLVGCEAEIEVPDVE